MKKKLFITILFSILLGIIVGIIQFSNNNKKEVTSNTHNNEIYSGELNFSGESGEENELYPNITPKTYDKINAIYSTGWVAGTQNLRESMIQNIVNNGFNAIVVDIKDEDGALSYKSEVQTAIDIKSSKNMVGNIKNVIQEYHDNGLYVIGRIVTFKDPLYAKSVKEIAYKNINGEYWTDREGNYWPNPYNEKCWDYPIELAKEAVLLGFDEIQFDYVRFPSSEGKVKQINYGFNSDTVTKSQVINKFLTRVMDEMADYKVKISVDVFGIITKKDGDFENIGQDFKSISKIVNVVCPMVYPSHYAVGEYNITAPDLKPYDIVYKALEDAYKRVSGESNVAEIRPYLQDFTASWLGKGYYQKYESKQVEEQIRACYDSGIKSFTLWDPTNNYCYDALEKANENKSGE